MSDLPTGLSSPFAPSPATSAALAARVQEGLALHRAGKSADAEALYRSVLAIDARHVDALHYLGILQHQRGRNDEAIELIGQVLVANPKFAAAHFNLGLALAGAGRWGEAIASFDRALAANPGHVDAHARRGAALLALERYAEALPSLERALRERPDDAGLHSDRASALRGLDRFDEALAGYDRAIALDPRYAEAHSNRASVLRRKRRFDDALASCDQALALRPQLSAAWNTRGNLLRDLGRHDEALASYARAQSIRPDYGSVKQNEGLLRLLLGDFERGWALYEERLRDGPADVARRQLDQRMPSGDASLAGTTVLLHSEQGMGDTIQFCRYAPLVAARGASVVLQVQAPLAPLMRTLEGVREVVAEGAPLPPYDTHCPLLSLPLAFGTTLDTVPAKVPYLHAEPGRLAQWSTRLGRRVRPRVGIAWSGNPKQMADHNRSMPFETIAALITDAAEYISVQKDVAPEDVAALAARRDVRTFAEAINDFADTAALIAQLDLVITVDTSVAHLAGAMGKPVWVMLPFDPDFRWLLGRGDSPWYPTARLFRQPAIGDWASVIAAVRTARAAHSFAAA